MANDPIPNDIAGTRRDEQAKAAAEAARANEAHQEARYEAASAAEAHADSAHLRSEAAVDHAAAQAANHQAAENEALRASIFAQRAGAQANLAAAERNYVDREVGEERRRASTFTFGFALCLAVLLATLFVGALYMLTRPRTADQVVVNAAPPPRPALIMQQPGSGVITTTPAAPTTTVVPGTTVAPPPETTAPGGTTVITAPGATTAVRPAGTPMQRVVVTPRAPYTTVFTSDPAAIVGKRVTFDIVNVENVIADRAFWVGPSTGERMLAVLDRGLDDGVMEKIVRVRTGQQRTMSGTIQRVPPLDEAKRRWKLDEGDVFDVAGQKYYVLVDRIDLR